MTETPNLDRGLWFRLSAIIAFELDVEPAAVVNEAEFEQDLGADSLDMIQLVQQVEEQFHIVIDDHETRKLDTVRDLVDLVERRLAQFGQQQAAA